MNGLVRPDTCEQCKHARRMQVQANQVILECHKFPPTTSLHTHPKTGNTTIVSMRARVEPQWRCDFWEKGIVSASAGASSEIGVPKLPG